MTQPRRRLTATAGVTAIALGLLLTGCVPRADAAEPAPPDLAPGDTDAGGKSGALGKLSSDLIVLHAEYQAFMADETERERSFTATDPALRIVDGRVVVDATASGEPALLELDLVGLGLEAVARVGPVVSGLLPIAALPDAAALATLRSMTAAKAGLR